MLQVVAWLLALELVGLVAFPLLFVLLPKLPDRGYAFARPIGLFLVFYAVWILASTPLVPNSPGTAIAGLLLLAVASGWIAWRHRAPLQRFLSRQWPLLGIVEVVFLGVFLFWVVFIAYNSAISHTEQPMDLAFLNATIVSDHFPPRDPWLAGERVSYYYFGYLIFGGLTGLTGAVPAVGYNLGLAAVAGMAAAAMFGLVSSMVRLAGGRAGGATLAGLLGVLLLLFVSNLEGGLELLRAGGAESEELWERVDIKGLDGPRASETWYPDEPGWWWWRATRVIDTVVDGASKDYTITEFPFFSFILGDLHPHVMSLPFVLSFLGLALAYFVTPVTPGSAWSGRGGALLLLLAIVLGGAGFINLWDLPVFGALLLGVAVVKVWGERLRGGWSKVRTLTPVALVVPAAVFLYLPFFMSFNSQAKGIVPVGEYVSRPLHFFIVWGLFLFVAGTFLVWEFLATLRVGGRRWSLLGFTAGLTLFPWVVWVVGEAVVLWSVTEALGAAWSRLIHIAPLAVLGIAAVYGALHRGVAQGASAGGEVPASERVKAVPLVMAAAAVFLLLGQELFYVADLFGNRMNTVFKLSYQAWTLLAAVSSYGIYFLLVRYNASRGLLRLFGYAWTGLLVLALMVSLYYPVAAAKTVPSGRATLDGLAHVEASNPAEYEAIQWLRDRYRPGDVLLEAVGDDYSEYGRVSASTGMPTVIGWTFHEQQWRGSRRAFEGRPEDVEVLYQTEDTAEAKEILERYGITYIVVGPRERARYGESGLAKFDEVGDEVFRQDNVVIYRVRE